MNTNSSNVAYIPPPPPVYHDSASIAAPTSNAPFVPPYAMEAPPNFPPPVQPSYYPPYASPPPSHPVPTPPCSPDDVTAPLLGADDEHPLEDASAIALLLFVLGFFTWVAFPICYCMYGRRACRKIYTAQTCRFGRLACGFAVLYAIMMLVILVPMICMLA